MLLGIASTTIHSYIIHLEFIDDNVEPAVKSVDMQIGPKYNVSYVGKDAAIYNITGRIVGIREVNSPYTDIDSFVREKKREEVGFNSSVYDSTQSEFFTLPKHLNADVEFIIDCSETSTALYSRILLSMIRDVSLVI